MKCITRLNQYSDRNIQINYGIVRNKYLRYLVKEDWEHIILYLMIVLIQREFIIKVYDKINKMIIVEEEYRLLMMMLNDITEYFKQPEQF